MNTDLTHSKHNVLLGLGLEDLENWDFPYSIQKAVYPLENLRRNKHWASHARVDNVYGDKNLINKRNN